MCWCSRNLLLPCIFVVIMDYYCHPPLSPLKILDREAKVLYEWAINHGASEAQGKCIVGLLSVNWMCQLPLPPRTRRLSGISDAHWHRYLFRRHINFILRWKERLEEGDPRAFSAAVNCLIRERFFPKAVVGGHGETSGGGKGGGPAPPINNCVSNLTVSPTEASGGPTR